jgi:membrane protease YdiL (CAAX protease family)
VRREPIVLAVALTYPTAMAYLYFVALSPAVATDLRANPLMQGVYAIGKVIQFGLPVACVALTDRSALRPTWPGSRGVPFGVAFGLAAAALTLVVYHGWLIQGPLFREAPARIQSKVAEFGLATPVGYVALAGFLAVVHSLLEEYYWRWFVYGRLRRHLPWAFALTVSGVAFMSHHVLVLYVYFPGWLWTAVAPFSLCIAVGGVVWAWLYERSGSLLGPWLSHLIVDAAIMAVGYDLLFHSRPAGG